MHELSLALALLDLVEDNARAHGASRVLAVTVEVGDLACVETDALRFAFEAAREGTRAAGASLALVAVPGRGRCAGCGAKFPVSGFGEACPSCGSFRVALVAGGEIRVRDLEVE